MRAHGRRALAAVREHGPAGHGLQQPAPWVIGLIVTATACRVLPVVGLVACARMERPNPVRFVGARGTCVTGVGLCGALFVG